MSNELIMKNKEKSLSPKIQGFQCIKLNFIELYGL